MTKHKVGEAKQINPQYVPYTGSLDDLEPIWMSSGLSSVTEPVAEAQAQERSVAQWAGDTLLGATRSTLIVPKVLGTGYGLATGNMDNYLLENADRADEILRNEYSDPLKKKIAARDKKIKAADGLVDTATTAFGETVGDAALALDTVASNLGSLVTMGGIGAAAKLAVAGRGLRAAQAAGPASQAALEAVGATASKVGANTALGAGSVLQGSDVAADVYKSSMAKPDAAWVQNKDFMDAVAKTDGSDEAVKSLKQEFALDAARVALPAAAALSLATGKLVPGGSAIENALVNGLGRTAGKGGIMAGVGTATKTLVGETGSEALEEGGGAGLGNVAKQHFVDPNQDLTENVGENTGMGAAGGFLMGGVPSAMQGISAYQGDGQNQLPTIGGQVPPTTPPNTPPNTPPTTPPPPANPLAPVQQAAQQPGSVLSRAAVAGNQQPPAPPAGASTATVPPVAPAGSAASVAPLTKGQIDFADLLDVDNVYQSYSNVRDGSDRANMREQMEGVAKNYINGLAGPNQTMEPQALRTVLKQQFTWFRSATPEQQEAAMSSLWAHAAEQRATSPAPVAQGGETPTTPNDEYAQAWNEDEAEKRIAKEEAEVQATYESGAWIDDTYTEDQQTALAYKASAANDSDNEYQVIPSDDGGFWLQKRKVQTPDLTPTKDVNGATPANTVTAAQPPRATTDLGKAGLGLGSAVQYAASTQSGTVAANPVDSVDTPAGVPAPSAVTEPHYDEAGNLTPAGKAQLDSNFAQSDVFGNVLENLINDEVTAHGHAVANHNAPENYVAVQRHAHKQDNSEAATQAANQAFNSNNFSFFAQPAGESGKTYAELYPKTAQKLKAHIGSKGQTTPAAVAPSFDVEHEAAKAIKNVKNKDVVDAYNATRFETGTDGKTRRADSDFFGSWADSGGVTDDIGSQYDAHGIAKSNPLGALLNILEHGVNTTRRFDSAPLVPRRENAAANSGLGSASGAYKDGPFILLGARGKSITEGIKTVLVSDLVSASIPALQARFPQIQFVANSNAQEVLSKNQIGNVTQQPAPPQGETNGNQAPQAVQTETKRQEAPTAEPVEQDDAWKIQNEQRLANLPSVPFGNYSPRQTFKANGSEWVIQSVAHTGGELEATTSKSPFARQNFRIEQNNSVAEPVEQDDAPLTPEKVAANAEIDAALDEIMPETNQEQAAQPKVNEPHWDAALALQIEQEKFTGNAALTGIVRGKVRDLAKKVQDGTKTALLLDNIATSLDMGGVKVKGIEFAPAENGTSPIPATEEVQAPEQASSFPRPERPASADKYIGSEFDALYLEAKLIDHKWRAPKEGDRQAKKEAWYVELRALTDGLAEAKKRRSSSLGAAPIKVTPQVSGNAEKFIHVAADSVAKLRQVDVERVLSGTPVHFRVEVAIHIKSNRADLVDEVDAVMTDLNEPAQAEATDALVATVNTYFTDVRPMDVPVNWLIMNAQRPLMGAQTVYNNDVHIEGRHFAAIDPTDSNANIAIESNKKLAAVMVVVASPAEQTEMALMWSDGHRSAYEEMPENERKVAVQSLIKRVQGKPYAEAIALLEAARANLAKPKADAPVATTHNGLKIYPTRIKSGDEVKTMWAVQTHENAERAKNGEREIGGDPLADTLEGAKLLADEAIATKKATDESNAAREAKEKAEADKVAADNAAYAASQVGLFIAGNTFYSAMQKGAAKKALSTLVTFRGKPITKSDLVEQLVAEGYEPTAELENKVQPMTRDAFNRANQQEQDAHDKRVKEGGKVANFYLAKGDHSYPIGIHQSDYAEYLLGQNDELDAETRYYENKATQPKQQPAPKPEAKAEPTDDIDALFDGILNEEIGNDNKEQKAEPADDIDALFDDVLNQELGRDGKAQTQTRAPSPEPRNRTQQSGGQSRQRTSQTKAPAVSQSLSNAAGNVGSGLLNAIDGLGALFGGKGKLNSGLTFDRETYEKAKPLFKAALADFKDAGSNIAEAMRTIIRMVLDKFGAEATASMKPYVVQFIRDVQSGAEVIGQDPISDIEASKVTLTPLVKHITAKGKELIGVIRNDITLDQAKSIDKYAFKKNGGVFVREQYLDELNAAFPPAKPASVTVDVKPSLSNVAGRVLVSKAVAEHLIGDNNFATIIQARQFITALTGEKIEAGTESAKRADEAIELGGVIAAREIVAGARKAGRSDAVIFDRLLNISNLMPGLNVRDSESLRQQAYSTPLPLAFIASRLAKVSADKLVGEPTAGNGALVMEANPKTAVVNELNVNRLEALKSTGFNPSNNDAATMQFEPNTLDSMVMNPPFGSVKQSDGALTRWVINGVPTTQVDHAIAMNSLEALKNDGNAVLIIGGTLARNNTEEAKQHYRNNTKFFSNLYANYNVVDHFSVDGKLYGQQGASYPVDVIVIRGRLQGNEASARALPQAELPQNVDTWEQLKEKLNEQNSVVPPKQPSIGGDTVNEGAAPRTGPVPLDAIRPPNQTGTGGAGGSGAGIRPADGSGITESTDRPDGASGETDATVQRRNDHASVPHGRTGGNATQQRGGRRPGSNGSRTEHKSAGVGDGSSSDNGLTKQDNGEVPLQVPYENFSGNKSVNTLVATNHLSAIKNAFERLMRRLGISSIDDYVRKELQYDPELFEASFSAEQVEALALAIDNIKRGKGFIIGDQTGIGKGRVVAAMIRYAKLNGKMPVFVTQMPDLFGDMMRDLNDIGMGSIKPLMTNNGASVPLDAEALEWYSEKQGIQSRIAELQEEVDRLAFDEMGAVLTTATEAARLKAIRNAAKKSTDSEIISLLDEIAELRDEIPARRGKFLDTPAIGIHEAALASMVNKRSIGDHDVIFTTYSQLAALDSGEPRTLKDGSKTAQKAPEFGFRNEFLDHFVDKNAMLILDESHNAGVLDANPRSVKLGNRVRRLIEKAGSVFYSSATFAKNTGMMDAYNKTDLGVAFQNPAAITSVINSVPMQQVASAMLVEAGQYLRRERSFAGIDYETKDVEVSKEDSEDLATSMRLMVAFDAAKKQAIDDIQDDLDRSGAVISASGGGGSQASVDSVNFTSVMHNVVNTFLLALKADATAQTAIDALSRGEKPIITVANTMETFITEYAKDTGVGIGEAFDATYADVLRKYLEKTRYAKIKLPSGQEERVYLSDEQLGDYGVDAYNEALDFIDSLNLEVPISPIDHIKQKVEDAGYTIGEITGRQTVLVDGKLRQRNKAEQKTAGKKNTISKFNNGGLDALIINRSGSTGLSMHASEKFDDQRRRVMVIGQAELDINNHMQMLGRINRTGQVTEGPFDDDAPVRKASFASRARAKRSKVERLNTLRRDANANVFGGLTTVEKMSRWARRAVGEFNLANLPSIPAAVATDKQRFYKGKPASYGLPHYYQMTADVPIELRPAAVLANKMAALNANTTAGRKSAVQAGSLDFMNKYGDRVAADFLLSNWAINGKLGSPLYVSPTGEYDSANMMTRLTGRIGLMALADQTAIYDVLTKEYGELIAQLDALGQNDLEAKTYPLDARTISTTVVIEKSGDDSPFTSAVNAVVVDVKKLGKPYSKEKVKELALKTLAGKTRDEHYQSVLNNYQSRYDAEIQTLKAVTNDTSETAERRSAAQQRITKLVATRLRFMDVLPVVGKTYILKTENGNYYGAVTDVIQSASSNSVGILSAWKVRIAIVDGAKSMTIPFSQIYIQDGAKVPDNAVVMQKEGSMMVVTEDRTSFESVPIVDAFDRAQTSRRENRIILTGNLLRATGTSLGGRLLNYTDTEGVVQQGVMLDAAATMATVESNFVPELTTIESVLAVINGGGEVIDKAKAGAGLKIRRARNGGVDIYLSGPNGKALVKSYNALNFTSAGTFMKAHISPYSDDQTKELQAFLNVARQKFQLIPDAVTVAEMKAAAKAAKDVRFSRKPAQTETEAFKKWFGDSKVVDENGKPLVVYHGAKQDIADGIFRMEKGMLGTGAYFTSNPQEAEFYTSNAVWRTEPNIIPSYITINNPYYAKDKWDKGALKAKDSGHDGVILLSPGGKSIEWAIPFSPTQVKSSIGNNGNFDATNPDIRMSRGNFFYSALTKSVQGFQAKQMMAGAWELQLQGLVKKGAIKQAELEWSGLSDWLKLQEGKVTKEQVLGYLGSDSLEASSMPLVNVREIVDVIRSTWKNSPDVVVAATMDDPIIPQAVRDADRLQMSKGTNAAEGFVYDGKVYVVASSLGTPQDVVRVLFHESLGHMGLRGVYGNSLKQVLNQVILARRKEVIAKAKQYGLDPSNHDDLLEAAEEVLAEMAQSRPELGFVRQAIAAIRNFLRTHVPMFKEMEVSDADIVQAFILPARRFVENGGGGGGGGGLRYLRAFHGTPHNGIEKFSTEKIGTGEGAQSYGWGLYFASKRAIAEHYRNKLSTVTQPHNTFDGKRITKKLLEELRKSSENSVRGFFDSKAANRAAGITNLAPALDSVIESGQEQRDHYQEILDRYLVANPSTQSTYKADDYRKSVDYYDKYIAGLEALKGRLGFRNKSTNGQLYEVEIPEESEMLSWDKPLSKQPESVQAALESAGLYEDKNVAIEKFAANNNVTLDEAKEFVSQHTLLAADIRGEELYRNLVNTFLKGEIRESAAQEQASKKLASLGIKGIKYLDGTSRTVDGDTHNYVIFDGADVAIEKTHFSRNGQLLAPNGKPSKLSEGQWHQVRTPQFKAFFGDWENDPANASKAVDPETGEPMVVYHGTNEDFSVFDSKKSRENGDLFVTPSPRLANEFAIYRTVWNGANVMPLFAKADNILVVDGNYQAIRNVERNTRLEGMTEGESVRDFARKRNYDGILFTNVIDPVGPNFVPAADILALFPTAQIKSAIGNNGDFDGKNPDIRFSRTPLANANFSVGAQRTLQNSIMNRLNDLWRSSGKVGYWNKSVGTQYHLSESNSEYKRTFDAVQRFLSDTSIFANKAADLAPTMLPKLEKLKDFVKKALPASDVKAVSNAVFGGTLYWARDKSGNLVLQDTLLKAAAQLTTQEKAQELLRSKKIASNVLQMWQGMTIEQYEGLVNGKYEKEMLPAGVVFTPAELKAQFGMTGELQQDGSYTGQIGLYQEFRKATNRSLTDLAVSEMVRMGGADLYPISEIIMEHGDIKKAADDIRQYLKSMMQADPERADEFQDTINKVDALHDRALDLMNRGYAPLMRFGKYAVYAKGADGEQLFFGMYESQREANWAETALRKNLPNAAISSGIMSQEQHKLFQGVSPETLALFGDAMGLDTDSEKAAIYQEFVKLVADSRSTMRRMLNRKGIAGYSEDATRVLAGFITSNSRKTASNLNNYEISKSVHDIKDGDVQDEAIKLKNYVQNPEEEAQWIRGVLFTQYIGGSIASAMVNLTQSLTMTFPYLSQFTTVADAGARMAKAASMAGSGKGIDAELKAALKRAEDDGVVAPQEIHQLMAHAQGNGGLKSGDGTRMGDAMAMGGNALSRAALAWGSMFSAAEVFNRNAAFIAAYQLAKDKNAAYQLAFANDPNTTAKNLGDPFAFAEKTVKETQGIYNKGNKPAWARGWVGSILFTFKQFSISYVEFLQRMYANNGRNGQEGKKAMWLALGVLVFTAGISGLPGGDDLDDVIDAIAQAMGYNFSTDQWKQELVEELGSPAAAQFVLHGFSGLPGIPIDVSGRMGLGNLIPGTGFFLRKDDHTRDFKELAGPIADLAARAYNSAAEVFRGNALDAAIEISPVAARNVVKGVDMLNTGMYRDAGGSKVIETDTTDAISKMIGFQPHHVAKDQKATFAVQKMSATFRMVKSEIVDEFAVGRFERDQSKIDAARKRLQKWNEKNPSTPMGITVQQVNSKVQNMNKTKAQRMIAAAPKEVKAAVRRELAEQ